MRSIVLLIGAVLFLTADSSAQQNFKITSKGAGGIELGMTVAQAKAAVPGCRFSRTSDGDGAALIEVKCKGSRMLTLFADEVDPESPVDNRARIEMIEIWNKRFKTARGVHVGMLVSEAERRLGKVKNIVLTQTEQREFITFSTRTPYILYRFYGGIYKAGEVFTTEYDRTARLWSIQVQSERSYP